MTVRMTIHRLLTIVYPPTLLLVLDNLFNYLKIIYKHVLEPLESRCAYLRAFSEKEVGIRIVHHITRVRCQVFLSRDFSFLKTYLLVNIINIAHFYRSHFLAVYSTLECFFKFKNIFSNIKLFYCSFYKR